MAGCMVVILEKRREKPDVWQAAERLLILLLVGMFLLLCRPNPGRTETISGELSRSHAAFLLSAARFTTWPADAFQGEARPLVFCVYKDRETGMALRERLQGETIKGRSLRQVDIDTFTQLSQCHVVYLPATRLAEYVAAANGAYGVLTVSDCREFAEADGMLGFIRSDQGVDVVINPEVMIHSGLSISPSLLQMAELVKTKNAGTGNRTIGR